MKILTAVSKRQHPDYTAMSDEWELYRYVLGGGDDFVEKYLEKYSTREDDADFRDRKKMTYCPGHAEASVMDIRNSIYQRMVDIVRDTNIESLNRCISGDYRGVDNKGSTLNSFMGRTVLTELLFLGRVGINIDRSPNYTNARSLRDRMRKHPYLTMFETEDIISWRYDEEERLVKLYVRYFEDDIDETTGLVKGILTKYKLYHLEDGVVVVDYFDDKETTDPVAQRILELTRIPFVILSTSRSLLKNIGKYQVALLNMESSDVNSCIKNNFTFYVEQYDPRSERHLKTVSTEETKNEGDIDRDTAKELTVKTGSATGRRYPLGAEHPRFIHPSPEPLRASMEKEGKIQEDIRKLINLNISMLEPRRASADSKREDRRGLESGLSYIGMELEHAERETAEIWAEYDKISEPKIIVHYPASFDMKSDEDRRLEAKEVLDIAIRIPSSSYRRELMKDAAKKLLGNKISYDRLEKIYKEIDSEQPVITDPKWVLEAHKDGLVSDETASMLLGYAKGEAEKAAKDHAERAARIVLAQQKAAPRGSGEMDPDNSAQADKDKNALENKGKKDGEEG